MFNKSTEIALQKSILDVVTEYDYKVSKIKESLETFKKAGEDLYAASTVCGTYSQTQIDVGRVYDHTIKVSLLKSAWLHIYRGLNIELIASAKDKRLFEQSLENLPEFTLENIRATFGAYIADPRASILRGLAEVFCDLDPAYKSHDKVKIGVKGLPKRIILTNVKGYGSWGRDRLSNVINALAQYQRKDLISYGELSNFIERDNDSLRKSRGIWIKIYDNGNGHLYFDDLTLADINKALAEYYGNTLADCYDDDKEYSKKQSTEVSKDLQYYPTPVDVVKLVMDKLYIKSDEKVLEPSAGCGRFLEEISKHTQNYLGIEYDSSRVQIAKNKGFKVIQANFLETVPTGDFDRIVMNPPFYGTHYFKHVEHALKFLKENGVLTAILPITARYDHGLFKKYGSKASWYDLPVGSFSESGVNINTTILTIRNYCLA